MSKILKLTIVDAAGKAKLVRLGNAQLYALSMANPEWPTKTPDARATRVLESLALNKLVYENNGRWYIETSGKEALAKADEQGIDY